MLHVTWYDKTCDNWCLFKAYPLRHVMCHTCLSLQLTLVYKLRVYITHAIMYAHTYTQITYIQRIQKNIPDSKVHGANMGPTWVLPAPDGPHVGPINLAIRVLMAHVFLSCVVAQYGLILPKSFRTSSLTWLPILHESTRRNDSITMKQSLRAKTSMFPRHLVIRHLTT